MAAITSVVQPLRKQHVTRLDDGCGVAVALYRVQVHVYFRNARPELCQHTGIMHRLEL